MVQTMGPHPLFWYIYSPQKQRGHRKSGAEGFNVILYSDGTLVQSRYDESGLHLRERSCFQLPVQIAYDFMSILDSEEWWIRGLPENIRATGRPAYTCMFAYVRHPLFVCEDLMKMTQLEDVNRNGVYARRLLVMMEFITEMLYRYGVLLTLDSFKWDWDKCGPVPENTIARQTLALIEENEREMMEIKNSEAR